jgi:hypothetical protein
MISSRKFSKAALFEDTSILITNSTTFLDIEGKDKGKAIPLQAWTDAEGSRRLRFSDFMTVGTWTW